MYYNSSDIVALISRNEGFGLANRSNGFSGKPIIGINEPGVNVQSKCKMELTDFKSEKLMIFESYSRKRQS